MKKKKSNHGNNFGYNMGDINKGNANKSTWLHILSYKNMGVIVVVKVVTFLVDSCRL